MNFALAKQLADKQATEYVGDSKAKCPKTKSCLMVVVYKADTKEVVSGAQVQVSGVSDAAASKGGSAPRFRAENTKDGIAKFTPFDPGSYSIDVSVAKLDGYEKPEQVSQSVSAGTCPVAVVEIQPLPKLKVKVVERGNHNRVFEDAVVKLTGPQSHPDGKTKKSDGTTDFGKTKSGKYVAQVTSLLENDRQEYILPKDKVEETLAAGDDKTVIIEVDKINVVTPKIELEYKVVLLERNLSQYQSNTEEKILADPTYIQLSYRETNSRYSFAKKGKGKVKFSPANVEVYQDEKCKKKFPGDPGSGINVTGEQLANLTGLKMYLRGKTAGKFDVQLELENAGDEHIKLKDNPATEKMGVVELLLKVHQYDSTDLEAVQVNPDEHPIDKYHENLRRKALPDQKELSDEKKVRVGRYLHVQSDKNADRTKLIVEKLDASQWPDGTDSYQIVVEAINTSGSLEIYEKQFDRRDSSHKPMPFEKKVSAMKAAHQELWAEGSDACKKLRDVRLQVGLDRPEGGLPKTPKHNGDWARFTVVQIKEIKVEYKAEAGKAVEWDPDKKRFYINFKKDPDGRKITISAQLTEKIGGVTLHFMLAPDKDNLKKANWNFDFPSTWQWKKIPAELKHKDKSDRKNVIHLSAKSDANGYAKKELVLSRFGGDKFHPAAYIDQDPHLAKYVDGHDTLEKRKPVFMEGHPLQVWRKVWYQVTRPPATGMPAPDGFVNSQRKVFLEPVVTEEKLMSPVDFTHHPYRPDWQFNGGSSSTNKLCIGTHNVDEAMALFRAPTTDTTPKFHVILCDEQFDAKGEVTEAQMIGWDTDTNPKDVETTITGKENHKVSIFDPPLQGGDLIVSAEWKAVTVDMSTSPPGMTITHEGNLAKDKVQVIMGRGSKRTVRVSPPDSCPGCSCAGCWGPASAITVGGNNAIVVQLQLRAADGGYLGWAPNNSVASVVKGGRADYLIHNTTAHELGHLVGQVRWKKIAGLPDHPKYYQKRGGSGTHCSTNATWRPAVAGTTPLDPNTDNERDAQGKGAGFWLDGDCIIFGYGVDKKVEWCEHCAFELIVSDLSKFV